MKTTEKPPRKQVRDLKFRVGDVVYICVSHRKCEVKEAARGVLGNSYRLNQGVGWVNEDEIQRENPMGWYVYWRGRNRSAPVELNEFLDGPWSRSVAQAYMNGLQDEDIEDMELVNEVDLAG
jgi:hypothetical protein